MDFLTIVIVVAVIIGAYLIWAKVVKKTAEPVTEEAPVTPATSVAPYKVEPPVEYSTAIDISPEVVARASESVPELKVVTGQPKKSGSSRSRVSRAKKAASAKTGAKPASKPRTSRKPPQPTP